MREFILILVCLLFGACTAESNKSLNGRSPSQNAEVVNASTPEKNKFDASKVVALTIEKAEIKVGGTGAAEIKLKIESPYHVNSNPPSEKTFIPLELSFENGDGITAGKTIYPKGDLKKFTFSGDKQLSVYSGEILVKLPLNAKKSVSAGEKVLRGKLKFQPCDEEVCYRPQTIDVNLPVTIN